MFSLKSKKYTLILDLENIVWKKIQFNFESTSSGYEKKFQELFSVPVKTLNRIASGEYDSGRFNVDDFCSKISKFSGINLEKEHLESDKYSYVDVGKILSLSRLQSESSIAKAYSKYFPTFSAFDHDEETLDSEFRRFSGLYYIYRLENNDLHSADEGRVCRMALNVRFSVAGVKRHSHGTIRSKLHIPCYSDDAIDFYQYDGVLSNPISKTSPQYYWIFEMRENLAKDMFFMISSIPRKEEIATKTSDGEERSIEKYTLMNGLVMTSSQGIQYQGPQASPVVIEKFEAGATAEDGDGYFRIVDKFMSEGPSLLYWDDVSRIVRHQLKKSLTFQLSYTDASLTEKLED